MFQASEYDLPADDIVSLRTAFDLIGKHRFGPLWTKDMVTIVRLGRRTGRKDERVRGLWALKALRQCVENGWLPLTYFSNDRRLHYFEGSGGLALHAVYPQPTDGAEGQVELARGGIFPCVVHTRGFGDLLRDKFAKPIASQTGPRRGFLEFDKALDQFFESHPLDMRERDVIAELNKAAPPLMWPSRGTVYRRICEAKERARERMLFANNLGRT
jgi:hypothetical protein